MDNKEPVVAAGLLSKLGELFFKGLDKILDSAAQYEEEYGVLKQVSRIPIADQNGREYTLTIKLSPVRDKDGKFYVEADTDAPGFDVSSINEKVFDLNKSKKDDFNKKIEEFVEKNNFSIKKDPNFVMKHNESDNSNLSDFEKEVRELVEKLNAGMNKDPFVVANDKNQEFELKVSVKDIDKGEQISVSIEPESNNPSISLPPSAQEVMVTRDATKGAMKLKDLSARVRKYVESYLRDHKLTKKTNLFTSIQLNTVKATFVKGSDNIVKIKAITSNIDIEDALDIAYDVADDEVFACSLSHEPQSFEIVESSASYDVNPIDLII